MSEEIRKTSGKETSTTEEMVVKGRSTKRGICQGLSREERRVSRNVDYVENLGISRRIAGKDRMHPRRTPQKNQRKIM